ncbi:zinc finger protein ZFP2 [Trichomycterus rosablanca]|uniref:zinc finger protein ZFP2 n=1 Tax=Trichomycterus rosablanca TaxID=2290929 RepID=UPI002F350E34
MQPTTRCKFSLLSPVQIKQDSDVQYTLSSDQNQSNSVSCSHFEIKQESFEIDLIKKEEFDDHDPTLANEVIHQCKEDIPHGLIPPVEMDDEECDTACAENSNICLDKPLDTKVKTIKVKLSMAKNPKSQCRDQTVASRVKTPKTCEGSFCCETCGKQFQRSDRLTDHRKVHRKKKPYPCDLCDMMFAKPALLKIHLRRHAGDRAFPCDQCEKRFFDRCDLKVHMRDHTGERPYVCQECGKSFKRTYVLNKHKKTHSKERPFKCDVCEKTYKYIYEYRLHIKKHST